MGKMLATTLVSKAVDIAKNYKTLYVMGCFGAPMTAANKKRYTQNHSYNKAADRTKMINAASEDTFGFDCVNLIKGILWGWCGDKSKSYGGAAYPTASALAAGACPDVGADGMIAKCIGVSTTGWASMIPGEVVWLSGHIGIYIGDGLAVECSPRWANRVQITAVGNIGKKAGYNTRTWTKHGKIPWVDYTGASASGSTAAPEPTRSFKVGDIVEFTGTTHYVSANSTSPKSCKPGPATVTQIYNGKHPYQLINVKGGGSTVYGWVDEKDIQTPAEAAIDKLAKLGVINSPDYWKKAVTSGEVKYLDTLLTKATAKISKAGERSSTPENGIGALVSAGVIDTPEYWLEHYRDYPSLGALLCALGGAVK